jgi:hypothetical protein
MRLMGEDDIRSFRGNSSFVSCSSYLNMPERAN